jgi:hypothetical protein
VRVTVDNFIRAETDLYFGEVVKKGGLGKFEHNRDPLPIDKQTIVRTNRDTLYSAAIFDPADHEGLNDMVRLSRPRAEILNGTWKFPEAKPVN